MRVFKSRFLKVFVASLLILSFSFSFVMAATVSVPYAEPSTSGGSGYLTIQTAQGRVYTYWWNCNLYGSSSNEVIGSANVNISISGENVNFNLSPLGSGTSMYYNLQVTDGSSIWLLGSSATSSNVNISDSWHQGNIVAVTYGGNIGTITGVPASVLSVNFGIDYNIYSSIDGILSGLEDIEGKINITNGHLVTIKTNTNTIISSLDTLVTYFSTYPDDIAYIKERLYRLSFNVTSYILPDVEEIRSMIAELKAAKGVESLNPLPSDSVTDFDDTSSSMREDNDFSSDFDDVVNDADFGSFKNGFKVVWELVEEVYAQQPVFAGLCSLVLSIGLISLIFNRR